MRKQNIKKLEKQLQVFGLGMIQDFVTIFDYVVDFETSASILVIIKSLPPVIFVALPLHCGHFIGAKAAIWLGTSGSTSESPSKPQSLHFRRPLIVFILMKVMQKG